MDATKRMIAFVESDIGTNKQLLDVLTHLEPAIRQVSTSVPLEQLKGRLTNPPSTRAPRSRARLAEGLIDPEAFTVVHLLFKDASEWARLVEEVAFCAEEQDSQVRTKMFDSLGLILQILAKGIICANRFLLSQINLDLEEERYYTSQGDSIPTFCQTSTFTQVYYELLGAIPQIGGVSTPKLDSALELFASGHGVENMIDPSPYKDPYGRFMALRSRLCILLGVEPLNESWNQYSECRGNSFQRNPNLILGEWETRDWEECCGDDKDFAAIIEPLVKSELTASASC